MIKGLQGITGITVSGGNTALPYVGPNSNNPMTGMLRIHGTEMEVFNGSSWQMLSASYATVGLDQDVLDIVQWARKKRDEEMMWQSLANDNKAVKIALDNLEQARQQLNITAKLAREYEQTTS
jgi:Tfp pilus assembly PilM family ATPase